MQKYLYHLKLTTSRHFNRFILGILSIKNCTQSRFSPYSNTYIIFVMLINQRLVMAGGRAYAFGMNPYLRVFGAYALKVKKKTKINFNVKQTS